MECESCTCFRLEKMQGLQAISFLCSTWRAEFTLLFVDAFKHGLSFVIIYQEGIIIFGPLRIDFCRVKERRTLLDNLQGK